MLEAYFTGCWRLILLGDEWRHYQELATDLTILTDTSVIFKRWMSESVNSGLLCNTTLPPPPPSIGVGQGQLSFFFFQNLNILIKWNIMLTLIANDQVTYKVEFHFQGCIIEIILEYDLWNMVPEWLSLIDRGWLLLSVYKHFIMVFSIIHLSVNNLFLLKSQKHKR